jgi:hypothetical protein
MAVRPHEGKCSGAAAIPPDDKLTQICIERLRHFSADPFEPWDGVTTMDAK